MKEIEITIDKDGKAEVDLKGFQGKGCSEVADQLIKAIGGGVSKRDQKHEYYKPVQKTQIKQSRS